MSFSIKTYRKWLAPAVVAAGLLASASQGQARDVSAALLADPSSLDPIYDTSLPALNVFYNIFDQLTGIDADGKVIPRLATKWSANEDLTEWTFTLRKDAKFHDGTPLTAADVVFTFQTALGDPNARLGGYLRTIDSVTATSDFEVSFKLKAPFAPFARQVTLVPIVSKAAYEKLGKDKFAVHPVGSGPYDLVSWSRDNKIELTRFNGYWGKPGKFDKVTFRPVPDETTRSNSVQSGDLDIALLGPSTVPVLEQSPNVNVISAQSNRVVYLGFDIAQPALKNEKIRKAIDMAIDRSLLGERLLNGAVAPASQLVAPVSFGYDASITPTEYNLDEAKALIAASGYDGKPITLSYPTSGLPQVDQVAQAMAFFLQEIGLKIELDAQEPSTFSSNWFSKQFSGLYLFAFAPSIMDADLPYSMLLKSGAQGYASDADIDALLKQQIGTADPEARAALLAKVSRIVKDKTYYAPIFVDTYSYGVTKGLDWTPRPDGMIVFN